MNWNLPVILITWLNLFVIVSSALLPKYTNGLMTEWRKAICKDESTNILLIFYNLFILM